MSWGALPWYVYDIEFEREQAKMLGAFEEEVHSGWVKATPDHWVLLDLQKRSRPEFKFASLGVNLLK